MAIQDIGYMQVTATLLRHAWAKIGAGNMYQWFWYYTATPNTVPTNILCLNLDTGVLSPCVRGPLGRPYGEIQHPVDNLFYLGTYAGSSVDSPICAYDFVTNTYTSLHTAPTYATGDGGPGHDGIGNNGIICSDEANKRVFYYGGQRAGLWAWDPITSGYQDYGIIDDPGGAWRQRYGNSIQVSATHAWLEMRDAADSLYLIGVRLTDGVLTLKWKGDYAISGNSISVYRGYDGNIYVKRSIGATDTWFNVTDLDTPISAPSVYTIGTRSRIDYTGYSAAGSAPDGSGNYTVSVTYTKPGGGGVVTGDILDVTAYPLHIAAPDLDGNLLCFPSNYGAVTKLNTTTHAKSVMGPAGGASLYALGQDYLRGKLYFGGYSQQSWEYDPSLPWNIGTNPKRVNIYRQEADGAPTTGARYHKMCWRGTDGNIWWPTAWTRTGYETQLIWYDPVGVTTGDVDFDDLLPLCMEGATINRARTKIVLTLFQTVSPYASYIAVATLRRKKITKYFTASGGWTQGRLVSAEIDKATTNRFVGIVPLWYVNVTPTAAPKPVAGEVMTGVTSGKTAVLWQTPGTWTIGVAVKCYFRPLYSSGFFQTESVTFSGTGTGTIPSYLEQSHVKYGVNLKTNAVLWGPTHATGAVIFGTNNASVFPPLFAHGYVWYYAGNTIVKIDPATGNVVGTPYNLTGGSRSAGGMCWVGDSLYHWDTTSNKMWQIPKADLGI